MKLLSVIKATKSNWRLWTLALAATPLSFATFTFDSFAQSLPKLMNSALLSHPSIASQRAQMQAAEIGIETAKWQYFPTPAISTERVNAANGDPFYSGDKNVTTVRLQQPLWTNGRLTAGKEKAQATLAYETADLNETSLQISLKVAQTYADLLASLWRMQSTEQSLATHQKLREQVQRRVDLGAQSDADLQLAQTRLDSVKSDLSATRARLESYAVRLKQLIGQSINSDELLANLSAPLSLPIAQDRVLDAALVIHPTIQKARAQSQIQEAIVEENRSALLPDVYLRADSIFSALQSSQRSNSNGQLPVSTALNTQFGQLNTNGEHQQYKVHLTAGQSYVFTMSHRPYWVGDAVLNTSLTLKDAQNIAVANGKVQNGNSRIDYLALKDGDFYLDASGSLPSMVDDSQKDGYGLGLHKIKPANKSLSSYEGKYAISSVEIPHIDAFPSSMKNGGSYTNAGNFDGVTNRVGFKLSLSAGDYIDLNFGSNKGFPKLAITNANGDNISPKVVATDTLNTQTFLAQKSGDYFIGATVNNELVKSPMSYQLTTTKNRDIEGNKDTKADLSINSVITSNLYDTRDHDWFKVQLNANKKYQFDLQKALISSNLDTFLSLRDSNGKQLAFNDDYADIDDYNQPPGGNRDSQLIYTAKTSGDYYIDAASHKELTSGAYTLSYKVI